MYQVANRLISASIVICGLAVSLSTALGAQLRQVEWQSDNSGTLRVLVDGKAEPSTEILDNGRRLRISLEDTTLGRNAVDVSGQGRVKGVFPYLASDGESVHIDLLMREPSEVQVVATEYGFEVKPRPLKSSTTLQNAAGSETAASPDAGVTRSKNAAAPPKPQPPFRPPRTRPPRKQPRKRRPPKSTLLPSRCWRRPTPRLPVVVRCRNPSTA